VLSAYQTGVSGRGSEAESEARAALEVGRSSAVDWSMVDFYYVISTVLLYSQRYEAAEVSLAEFDALLVTMKVPPPPGVLARLDFPRALVRLERGDARGAVDIVDRMKLNLNNWHDDTARLLRASALCSIGRADEGLGEFERWLPQLASRSHVASPHVAQWRAHMGLCALSAGRKQQAREASALASAAIAAQPAVAPYFKAPVLELEKRLRRG
jgi:hypothetical protein